MITKVLRTKMKKILKRSFIPDIQNVLKEKNILNKKGNEYSVAYISNVFNGKESNKDIEDAIFDVYELKKKELAKMQENRKKRLESIEKLEQ
jgi:hypothetical protein